MPSHEDMRLVPMMIGLDADESDEVVDAALAHLAGGAGSEALSSVLFGLSGYDAMDEWDWDAIAEEEEARLEQRCRELVQTIDDAIASPAAANSSRFDAEPLGASAAGMASTAADRHRHLQRAPWWSG